jgi:exopolyphosphatase
MSSPSATTTSSKHRYLPLYQAEVADLILRPENGEAFSRSKVNPAEHILFLDDLKGYEIELYSRGVRYALVDANNLTPRFGEPTKEDQYAVIGILDHHEDLGLYSKAEPRWIQVPSGSCASLVTEYFYPRLQPADFKSVPKTLVDLLISSIIIDTDNGKPAPKGKAVQTDQDALRHLLPLSSYASSIAGGDISTASSSSSLATYHELLVHEKYDLSPLKGRDLLRRDYKEYISEHAHIRYGLSSVPMALQVWLDREEISGSWDKILQELENWGAEKNLDFVGVLTSYFSPKKNGNGTKKGREQLYLVRSRTDQPVSEDKLKQIFEYLQQDETLELDTLKSGEPSFTEQRWQSNTYAFEQKQASATRKQVAPALKKAVEAVEQ